MEHATKGKKHAEKVALRRYLHNIKLKIMLNVYELSYCLVFFFNVLLFVWVGNDTFAHWRQLPGSLWAGVCDYDQFWSLAGRVAQSAEAMPNFSFCYVTSRKTQLFCAPILYRYIIIKLYNNTTIFSSLLPIKLCVCFRGSAPDAYPAGGLTAPPRRERLCIPKKVSLNFFFPNDMPALYTDVHCTRLPHLAWCEFLLACIPLCMSEIIPYYTRTQTNGHVQSSTLEFFLTSQPG